MNKVKLLKEARKYLDTQYFTTKLDKTCFAVLKEENGENPFLIVTYDPKMFDGYVLSFSVNFTKVHEALNILLNLQDLGPVALEEQFFINKHGVLFFGEEAEMLNNPLFDMEVEKKELH